MSTNKRIDIICIASISITLIVTILFMFNVFGITAIAHTMPYESTLFDSSYVHSIDIVMNDWDTFIENCESEEYSECTVVIDGEKHSNIAIRAKGNTSLSTVSSLNSDRYSFKLEFDHYDNSKSMDGLDKLCLNNLIQDNTMMKDYIVYTLMDEFGVDSPLCSFAYLTVNGEDWGLYLAVEGVEDSFLTRNYGSEVGELYKPDSISNGGGRGNGKDFNMDDFDFGNNTDGAETGSIESNNTETSSQDNQNNQNGNFPQPNGNLETSETNGQSGTFDPSTIGGQGGGFDPSTIGGQGGQFNPNGQNQQSDGTEGNSEQTDVMPGQNNQGNGMQGGMNTGMGSDDVKLKYIDDDPDSYSNIFTSAKTDITSADEERLIQSLKNLSEYTNLENTVDIDEVIRYFVIHNFVCNGDSYTGSMIHNYYLYEEDGILSMIPWDYNLAFGTFQGNEASSTINTSIDSPISGGTVDDRPMLGWIFSSEEYTEQYHKLFAEFISNWFSNGELENLITETAEMIRSYVEKDPTKFCTIEEFDAGVEALTQFVTLRSEAVSKQLNGDDSLVDTGSLNLSDMGTMNNGGGAAGGGGMSMPDMQNINMLSFVSLKDSDGNEVDITTVIPSDATIVSVTLSDNSVIDLSSANMQSLSEIDVDSIVLATDSNGNSYDLSPYTISLSVPNGQRGQNEQGVTPPNFENRESGREETIDSNKETTVLNDSISNEITTFSVTSNTSVATPTMFDVNSATMPNGDGQTMPNGDGQTMPNGGGQSMPNGEVPTLPNGETSTVPGEQENLNGESTSIESQEDEKTSESKLDENVESETEDKKGMDTTVDTSTEGQTINPGERNTNKDFSNNPMNQGENNVVQPTDSETTKWIYIGVSAIVLAFGIIFAIKKKY